MLCLLHIQLSQQKRTSWHQIRLRLPAKLERPMKVVTQEDLAIPKSVATKIHYLTRMTLRLCGNDLASKADRYLAIQKVTNRLGHTSWNQSLSRAQRWNSRARPRNTSITLRYWRWPTLWAWPHDNAGMTVIPQERRTPSSKLYGKPPRIPKRKHKAPGASQKDHKPCQNIGKAPSNPEREADSTAGQKFIPTMGIEPIQWFNWDKL